MLRDAGRARRRTAAKRGDTGAAEPGAPTATVAAATHRAVRRRRRARRRHVAPVAQRASLVGATASGKSALALALARARPGVELVSVDSMQVYRGMDIGTAKPTAAEQAEVPHHLLDLLDPWEDGTVAWLPAAGPGGDRRHRGAAAIGPCSSAAPASTCRRSSTTSTSPGSTPRCGPSSRPSPTRRGPARAGSPSSTRSPPARMEPTNRRRIVRALEVTLGSGRPFSATAPASTPTRRPRFHHGRASRCRASDARRADRGAATPRRWRPGSSTRCGACCADPGGISRTARQALGYKELLAHLDGALTLDEALDLAVRRTRRFARRQRAWFRRDPRITWLARRRPATCRPAASRARRS